VSQPETPEHPAPEEPQPTTPKLADLVVPRPSYEPGPVVEDLIMTIERGLQIVQGDSPEHHRAHESKTKK
jgi:hypothetical protein